MMMMGLKFMGDVPFREVYITGLIRDEHGDKMSKSKGNVIDPLDIVDGIGLEALVAKRTGGLMQPHMRSKIEKATRKSYPEGIASHGTDALRFTFAALASPSRDIRFDLARVAGYRNFCNKLWNAARFVAMSVGADSPTGPSAADSHRDAVELSVADRWIRSRFGRAVETVEESLADYRFDHAAAALYEFTWHEFCDWYLELTKPVLQSDSSSAAARAGTRRTLLEILEALQRALHPIMPFITEEIWQRTAPLAGCSGPTVMLAAYPRATDFPRDEASELEVRWLQTFILAVRQIRGEMSIAPSRRIPLLYRNASVHDIELIGRHHAWLERLAGIDPPRAVAAEEPQPQAATALVGELTLLVPMAGLIDAAAEAQRLAKLLARARSDLEKTGARLANDNFVRNAPEAVVSAERQRVADLEQTVSRLATQLERVQDLRGPGTV
jgi:valyl-tRNA synthetase